MSAAPSKRRKLLLPAALVVGLIAVVGAVLGLTGRALPPAVPVKPLATDPMVQSAATAARGAKAAQQAAEVSQFRQAARFAAEALVLSPTSVSYDPETGIWSRPVRKPKKGAPPWLPTWWQSAIVLRSLLRYVQINPSAASNLQRILDDTYNRASSDPGKTGYGRFENVYMDDTGWWGLTWTQAASFELQFRHDANTARKYLALAQNIADYMKAQRTTCGGGGIDFRHHAPSSAITDQEFIALSAQLAQLQQHGPLTATARAGRNIKAAQDVLDWMLHKSKLVNMQNFQVQDTLNHACRPFGAVMIYTQGEMGEALTQLGKATGNRGYYKLAQQFLNAVLTPSLGFVTHGVLHEPCELYRIKQGPCGTNSYNVAVFKGLAVDAMADWAQATGSSAFDSLLHRQASAVLDNASGWAPPQACDSTRNCVLTMYWLNRTPLKSAAVPAMAGSQASGLSALTDAVLTARPADGDKHH